MFPERICVLLVFAKDRIAGFPPSSGVMDFLHAGSLDSNSTPEESVEVSRMATEFSIE
jgi:hypothetical protein